MPTDDWNLGPPRRLNKRLEDQLEAQRQKMLRREKAEKIWEEYGWCTASDFYAQLGDFGAAAEDLHIARENARRVMDQLVSEERRNAWERGYDRYESEHHVREQATTYTPRIGPRLYTEL